jgi:hypothetical protein
MNIENEIQNVINGKESVLTYDNAVSKNLLKDFNSFINRLAFLYKNSTNISEKNNIRNFFFIAFNPYKNSFAPSFFTLNIGKWAGIHNLTFAQNEKTTDLIDMIADVIFDKIETVIEKYNPNKGNFKDLLSQSVVNGVIDVMRKRYGLGNTNDDDGYAKEYSLDNFVNQDNPDDRMSDTISSGEFEDEENQQTIANIANAITEFVHRTITNKKLSSFYDMFVVRDMSYEDIKDETGLSNDNLRVIKFRFEKEMSKYVENGLLKTYVYERTGHLIKFPENTFKIQKMGHTKQKSNSLGKVAFNVKNNDENGLMENKIQLINSCMASVGFIMKEGFETTTIDPHEYSSRLIDEVKNLILLIINNLNELNELGYDFSKEYKLTNKEIYNKVESQIALTVPEMITKLNTYTKNLNDLALSIKKTYV